MHEEVKGNDEYLDGGNEGLLLRLVCESLMGELDKHCRHAHYRCGRVGYVARVMCTAQGQRVARGDAWEKFFFSKFQGRSPPPPVGFSLR